jgi:hypothetical protein
MLSDAVLSCGNIDVMSETNEWNLLKRQFDELTRDDSAGSDSIELDADFHHRFAELMNRICGPSKYYQKADPFPHSSDVGTHRSILH